MDIWKWICLGWLFNENNSTNNSYQDMNYNGICDHLESTHNCLDLNHNGICDYIEATTDCWDLNGNGINDMFEDTSY